MKRRTTLPKPYLPPQRRTRHRLSHRLHRQCRCGVIPLPQRALHPTDHVQQETHPTDNPPQSARKNGAGEARRRGGRRRGRPPSADHHRPRGTRHHPAPSTGTPQQQDTLHSAHLHKRPTLPETRTQPATGIDRRTPTTRCHSAWAKVSHTLAPGVNVAAAWSPAAAAAPTPRPAARPARTFLMGRRVWPM